MPEPRPKSNRRRRVAILLGVALLAFLVAKNPFFAIHRIAGVSMWPTYSGGEWIVVSKASRPPQRGEIVVLEPTDDGGTWLKRVVALGGERVLVSEGDLLVSTGAVAEPVDPMRRTVAEIIESSAPIYDLANLRSSADCLLDEHGLVRLRIEKGSVERSSDGAFLQLGKAGEQIVLRSPDRDFVDDRLDATGAFAAGTRIVRDLILTVGIYGNAAGVLRIEHWVNGGPLEVFRLDFRPDGIAVQVNGADAGRVVLARPGAASNQFLRCLMCDRRLVVETKDGVDAKADFSRLWEGPRPALPEATGSYLKLVVESGSVILSRLEVRRDIHYTRDHGEARFAISSPLSVLDGNIFVLGDNSAESEDGRRWGDLHPDRIVGRPVFVLWPPARLGRR